MLVAGNWTRRDGESSAGYQSDWLVVFQFAGADLWT